MTRKPYFSTATHLFYETLDMAIDASCSYNQQHDGEVSDFEIMFRDSEGEDNIIALDHTGAFRP